MKFSFWKLGIFLFVVFAFFANSLHESYPDEFDNILGGWYLLHGSLPYVGFFTHHGPVPYFIAALVEIFSGQSFVIFRLVYAFLLIIITFATFIFLKQRVGENALRFYPLFIVFLSISATYYWTQMLLADNSAALAFLPAYALIILKVIYKKRITLIDIAAVSILSSIGLYSSLTYIYIFILIHIAILYLYFRSNGYKPLLTFRNVYPIAIVIFPHLLFFLYLLFTQSLSDYVYQNFIFNAKYYIYNYPRASEATFINPVRYAILIAHWFFVNFYTVLLGTAKFDFSFPINMTMAIGNIALVIYLIFSKRYKLAAFVILTIIYTNVRSNPLNSKETDYQSAVYSIFSFFNIFFLLPKLYESLNANIAVAKKIVFGFLLLLLGLYGFFTLLHLTFKFNSKVVSKYMGDMPLIYDRPKIAPIINAVVDKNEYAWIGPFEFEELFYTNSKIPSKYHILVYGIGASAKIRTEMLVDFQKNKPKVIMFDKEFVYLGKSVESYSEFFLQFLSENYVTLFDYHNGDILYRFINQPQNKDKFNLESKIYIRKNSVNDVIKRLLEKKYIRQVSG
jgi:hypothetical protein